MLFSDYIVYCDESGDHGLDRINPQNPMFALVFCIFEKERYRLEAVPDIQRLKFDPWGHDCIVLHSYELRNQRNEFAILNNRELRAEFLSHLNDVMDRLPFTIVASVINKPRLVERYINPANPYEISLTFCMERLQAFLMSTGQSDRRTHILVECRGAKEDASLRRAFQRIAAGANLVGPMPNLELRFMDKKHNSTGLQIADLVAYPIARRVIDPQQPNRAFEIVERKLRRGPAGSTEGFGLKVFPK